MTLLPIRGKMKRPSTSSHTNFITCLPHSLPSCLEEVRSAPLRVKAKPYCAPGPNPVLLLSQEHSSKVSIFSPAPSLFPSLLDHSHSTHHTYYDFSSSYKIFLMTPYPPPATAHFSVPLDSNTLQESCLYMLFPILSLKSTSVRLLSPLFPQIVLMSRS